MTVTILLKYWKGILLIVLLFIVMALSSLCFIQHKELSLNDANVKRINTEWEARFNKINEEGIALQKEYDLLALYGKSFYFCTRFARETKCFLEMLIKRL